MRDPSDKYASDKRTSEELVEAYRRQSESGENNREALAILHFRGGQTEFEIGKRLAGSGNPEDRSIGADILGQLGWSDRTFLDEIVNILIQLLYDPDPYVIYCAAFGLGHRGDSRAIPHLIKLTGHEDPFVRYGVAFGLIGHDDERAISSLIQLSRDSDHDTRNWAMFGLGSQTEMDSPAIREALIDGLADPDPEIRGEALVGLARRKDPMCLDALLKEWELDTISILSLEAAEHLAEPKLVPYLKKFQLTLNLAEDKSFENQLGRAMSACQPSTPNTAKQEKSTDAKNPH
jgi:HEAT repeat protein